MDFNVKKTSVILLAAFLSLATLVSAFWIAGYPSLRFIPSLILVFAGAFALTEVGLRKWTNIWQIKNLKVIEVVGSVLGVMAIIAGIALLFVILAPMVLKYVALAVAVLAVVDFILAVIP